MSDMFQRVSSEAAKFWCKTMHPAPMWPIHDHYVCPSCQRHWPVPWVEQQKKQQTVTQDPQGVRQLHPVQRVS